MAGTARLYSMIASQSEMNGGGYESDVASGIPNQSVGYHGRNLRQPYVRPWTTGQTVVAGEVKHNNGNEYSAGAGGVCGATAPTHGSGAASDGAVTWTYLRAAGATIGAWPGNVVAGICDLFKTSANRVYEVVVIGSLSATEPTSTSTTGITPSGGSARLRYLGTTTETLRVNAVYRQPKIFHNTNLYFQPFAIPTTSTTAASGSGKDADDVRIFTGPQVPLAAHIINRNDDDHNYFVKHAVDGRPLGYIETLGNYSIQGYDAGGGNALLKNGEDARLNAIKTLLASSVTAWASGQSISTVGTLRKNSGSVYMALSTGTTSASVPPVHTSGDVSDGTVTWRFSHTVYDTVIEPVLIQEHGAQETNYNVWTYDARYGELNVWRRHNHRTSYATGSGVAVIFIEPFEPRNQEDAIGGAFKSAFAPLVRNDLKAALSDYADAENGSAITPTDRTNDILFGSRGAWIKRDGLYAAAYFDSTVDRLHSRCAGTEAIMDRVATALDDLAPAARTYSSETVSFYGGGSRPVLTISTPPSETYAPGAAVTATLANSGLNGGSASSIEWYKDQDDSVILATGLTCTYTPSRFGGQVLHARYKDPNGYWAHWFGFVYVLAPRDTVLSAGTPKHWIRGAVGAVGTNLAANGSIDYIPNYTGATSGLYAVRGSGVTVANRHHDGIAMQKLDVFRFNNATTDGTASQQAAALVTASNNDFTLILKTIQYWRGNDVTNLLGTARYNASANINGGHICLAAASGNDGDATDFRVAARYTNDLTSNIVGGSTSMLSTDQYNAGDQMIVALSKTGNTWEMRGLKPDGSIWSISTIGAVALDADGYPTAFGWLTSTISGGEGLWQEEITFDSGLTSSQIDPILRQLALTENLISGDAADASAASATLVSTNRELRMRLKTAGGATTYVTKRFYQPLVFTSAAVDVATGAGDLTTGVSLAGDSSAIGGATADLSTAIAAAANAGSVAAATGDLSTGSGVAGDALTAAAASGAMVNANLELRVRLQDGSGNKRYYTKQFYRPSVSLAGDAVSVASSSGAVTTAISFSGDAADVVAVTGSLASQNKELRVRLQDGSGNKRYYAQQFFQPSSMAAAAQVQAGATGDLSIFTGVAGAAGDVSSASGDLTAPVGFSGAATVQSTASADLNTISTVTLAAPINTGPGSICDSRYWTGAAPKSGDVVAFETRSGFSIASNGDISALVDTGEFAVQYFDGASIYSTTVVLSANYSDALAEVAATGDLSSGVALVGAALVDVAVSAALTTAIQFVAAAAAQTDSAAGLDTFIGLAADAQGQVDATATAATGIAMAGNAQGQTDANATATTGIALNTDAAASADATGNLSAGAGLAGSGVVQQDAGGVLDTGIAMAGDAGGDVSASGSVSSGADLRSDAQGESGSAGALGTAIHAEGDASSQVDAAGSLDTAIGFNARADVDSTAQADIDTAISMAGDAAAEVGAPALLASTKIPMGDRIMIYLGDLRVAA